MSKKYPPLDRGQVETILKNAGFICKRQKASHAHWEGTIKGQRRIVTVDHLKSKKEKYGPTLLRKMIEQSGLSKKEFYSYLLRS
jgi:predicted RNA binding protein YcfA (HicA-like mRNA interferase family)